MSTHGHRVTSCKRTLRSWHVPLFQSCEGKQWPHFNEVGSLHAAIVLRACSFVLSCDHAICVRSPYSTKSHGGSHMIISPRHSIFKTSQPVVCPDTLQYFGKVAFKSVKFWHQLGWLGKLATFWALTVTPPPTSTTICWGTTPFIPYSKLYTGLKSTKIIQKETA